MILPFLVAYKSSAERTQLTARRMPDQNTVSTLGRCVNRRIPAFAAAIFLYFGALEVVAVASGAECAAYVESGARELTVN